MKATPVFYLSIFCLFYFHKKWYHKQVEGIMACISGPVGTWATPADWKGPSRVEQAFKVCLWTSEDENVLFCEWHKLYLLPLTLQLTLHL